MPAVLAALLLLTGSTVYAGPNGNGASNGGNLNAAPQGQWNAGMPPGFSPDRGQKRGWQGNTAPRGWNAGKGQKKGWGGQTVPKGIGKKQ
jgi:hypothetical protein